MTRANDSWRAAVLEKDSTALGELRQVVFRGLRKGLSPHAVSDAQVEDFTQDALVRIQASIERFRGESQFITWALSLAMRVAFDELRKARWKDVSLDSTADDGTEVTANLASDTPGQDQELGKSHVLDTLRSIIANQLTDRQREVLESCLALEGEGMPIAEVAARLGTNRNALYKLTHDARRKVKRALEERGITSEDIGWALR